MIYDSNTNKYYQPKISAITAITGSMAVLHSYLALYSCTFVICKFFFFNFMSLFNKGFPNMSVFRYLYLVTIYQS